MVDGKVWIDEKPKTISKETFGSFTVSIKKHYDKYNIQVDELLDVDPMNSDYISSSISSKTVINEWIDDYDNALNEYDKLVAYHKSLFEKGSKKIIVIGDTYVEMWSNNINYFITIGSKKIHAEQHTVFTSSSETDTVKKFIALSNSFRDILG